jgi:ParB family chromosome partitioning protein
MFFTGEPSAEEEPRTTPRTKRTDLAGDMARDAQARRASRSRGRSGSSTSGTGGSEGTTTTAKSTAKSTTAKKSTDTSAAGDETAENIKAEKQAPRKLAAKKPVQKRTPAKKTTAKKPTEAASAGTKEGQSAPEEAPREDSPVVDVETVEYVPVNRDGAAQGSRAGLAPTADGDAALPTRTAAGGPSRSPEQTPDSPEPSREEGTDGADEEGPELLPVPGAEFAEIPIQEIRENPRNPRTDFDDDSLDELAYSLREVGVLQPVVVRSIPATVSGESFELVMGERRWRAARRAGLQTIPAIIRQTSDDDLHRSQLSPLEEAAAYQQLLEDFGCTQDELADRIGRSRPQISNTLRLMRLPALVQRRVASGALSAGHARALLSLEDSRLMEELAQRIVAEGLSVREVERLVSRGTEPAGRASTPRRSTYNPRVVDITSRLSNRLEAPVKIDVGKRKGRITLEFTNLEDLERLVERIGLLEGTDEERAEG